MTMDVANEKHSIKNLLFTRAIPNYVIPVPLNGHKVHMCTDCGDKFLLESSYNDHVNRKSVKISYMCRHCNQLVIFNNRCNLLFHIRSHVFKTTTINVSDLKIEPLQLSAFKNITVNGAGLLAPEAGKKCITTECFECGMVITGPGPAYKDRAKHLMQYINEVHSCPVCLFALPTLCGLKAHLRLHLKIQPYVCPECGVQMAPKNLQYPYCHDCEGFKMMRATVRTHCEIGSCVAFHPNDYKEHMKEVHLKKVYKCPYCVVACFNEKTMKKHYLTHEFEVEPKPLIFYQCDACPGRFVMQNHINQHLKNHIRGLVFPCWTCGTHFKDIITLLEHFTNNHCTDNLVLKNTICQMLELAPKVKNPAKTASQLFRVVKRCGQCKRNFIYKCKQDSIQFLPIECPYNCSTPLQSVKSISQLNGQNTSIRCHLCRKEILQDWAEIKKHYKSDHKSIRCLDAKIRVERIDISKYVTQKRKRKSPGAGISKNKKLNKTQRKTLATPPPEVILVTPTISTSEHACSICGEDFNDKLSLEGHIVTHRDPCMAYQCMECGQSFVVKPSFSKHLLLEHNITDVDDYITAKQCYNENALIKYQDSAVISNEPLGENQCKICREQFGNAMDLEKHFRVHGMAFLKTKRTP